MCVWWLKLILRAFCLLLPFLWVNVKFILLLKIFTIFCLFFYFCLRFVSALKQFTHNLLGNLPTETPIKERKKSDYNHFFLSSVYIKTTQIICSNCNSVSESTKIYCIYLFSSFFFDRRFQWWKKVCFEKKKYVCVINQ